MYFSGFSRRLRRLVAMLPLAGMLTVSFVGSSLSGCVPSDSGYRGSFSVANANPKPMSLMVARKIDRTLYIILDPARVPDTWTLENNACANDLPGCSYTDLTGFQSFVSRDLRIAMANYFSRVLVVAPSFERPSAPYAVAEVKVDNVVFRSMSRTYNLGHIEMTWAFALRLSEDEDFAYSYAGGATSSDMFETFEIGYAQLVENAIPVMLKEWTEKGGFKDMLNASTQEDAHPVHDDESGVKRM